MEWSSYRLEPSDDDVLQVSVVCPDVEADDIRADLTITGNVESTVNRILDGTFQRRYSYTGIKSEFVTVSPATPSSATSKGGDTSPPWPSSTGLPTAKTSSTECSTTDSNTDSDLELPDLVQENHENDLQDNNSSTDINSDGDLELTHANIPVQSSANVENCLRSRTSSTKMNSWIRSKVRDMSDDDNDVPVHVVPHIEKASKCLDNFSEPLSISSDDNDDLADLERKPLSTLLFNKASPNHSDKGRDLSPPLTNFSFENEEDDLPDLAPYEFHEALESESCPESDSMASSKWTSDWSQGTTDTGTGLSSSQQSVVSTDGNEAAALNPKKKKRRTPEEIEESRRQAQMRKEQRGKVKLEKEQKKAREAQVKKARQDAKKQHRPGDCMKYVTVVVDLGVINAGPGAAILASFEGSEVSCVAESQPVPDTITWRRQVIEHYVRQDMSLETIQKENVESEVLLLLSTAEFVELVYNMRQEQSGGSYEGSSLLSRVRHVKSMYGGRNVTVLGLGMERYFRDQKTEVQRQHREAVRTASTDTSGPAKKRARKQKGITTALSRVEVEEALVCLQLETGCNCQLVETSKDLLDLVKTFTKAVAEAPSKKDRLESAFSFLCEGNGAGKVDKNGVGLLKVWKLQLQQFKTISAEMSNAIVAAYPSPQLLIQAYRKCLSEREAERLLENIVVRRGAGALATNRKIGKELSRRVYQLMNFRDPDHVIT